jgi:hypothetical protein
MVSALLSRCLILVLGTLYPAYRSYKAIKTKNPREYVKWMMYWTVFALFTTLETFLDIFFSWFPFYYEIKILFILWVLSPATHGSSMLYKKVVHPLLVSREKEIDELIEKAKQQGYSTCVNLFSSGFQYASNLFLNSAIKGQSFLGSQLKKSLSMNDVYDGSNKASLNNDLTNSNQGGYFNRKPDTINEDDEDSDYESDQTKRVSNKIYETEILSLKTNRRQPGLSPSVGGGSTRGVYEIIDDDDFRNDEVETRRLIANAATTTATTTATRRRASAKTLNSQNSPSYRSNEARKLKHHISAP